MEDHSCWIVEWKWMKKGDEEGVDSSIIIWEYLPCYILWFLQLQLLIILAKSRNQWFRSWKGRSSKQKNVFVLRLSITCFVQKFNSITSVFIIFSTFSSGLGPIWYFRLFLSLFFHLSEFLEWSITRGSFPSFSSNGLREGKRLKWFRSIGHALPPIQSLVSHCSLYHSRGVNWFLTKRLLLTYNSPLFSLRKSNKRVERISYCTISHRNVSLHLSLSFVSHVVWDDGNGTDILIFEINNFLNGCTGFDHRVGLANVITDSSGTDLETIIEEWG